MPEEYFIVCAEPEEIKKFPYAELGIFSEALKYYLVKAPADVLKKGVVIIQAIPETFSNFRESFRSSLDSLLEKEGLPVTVACRGYTPLCAGGPPPTKVQIEKRDSRIGELYSQLVSAIESAKLKLATA